MRGHTITRTWQHQPRLHAPARYRRACRYEAFVPLPLEGIELKLPVETAGVVSEAEGAIRDLNAEAHPALAPLRRLLLRTESIASSKVEGMQLDARKLARAEARADAGDRVGSSALEVLANIDAMELAIEEAASGERFTVDSILRIHERLMERSPRPETGGKLRSVQNWIGGNDYNPCSADFVPPPAERVEPLLVDLCAYLEADLHPPLLQAALVHAQFETIHPFQDGNGRSGRALIHVVLRRRGVAPAYLPPISVILAGARERYISGLGDYRADRVAAWIDRFSAAALGSARLASEYLEAVRALIDRWREQLERSPATPRADATAWTLIEVLPAHPIVTAPVAASATGRSRPAVYDALDQLEAAGVLLPLKKGRRNRAWEAAGLLDLLAGLEAGVSVDSIR